jgi:hypothetical protein
MKKLILSSETQLIHLIRSNPDILNVPGLSTLRPLAEDKSATNKSGCSTCQKNANPLMRARAQVESVLSNMTQQDYLMIKSLLKMDKICYYHKVDGKLLQTCL